MWVCVGNKCSECLKARITVCVCLSLADLKKHPRVETPKHPTYLLIVVGGVSHRGSKKCEAETAHSSVTI